MKPLDYKLNTVNRSLGPGGPGVYYKCLRCGFIVDSTTKEPIECRCKNVYVELGHARADDPHLIKILSAPLEEPGLLLKPKETGS